MMAAANPLVRATIKSIWQETPSTKGLQLVVDAVDGMCFQPGQWVDFHAPGVQHVGGYSICSTPQELQQTSTFDLCVKSSRHPCAQWVHQQAAPGDKVDVRVGGTFTLADSNHQQPRLFVAGGIGITCLSSMLGHIAECELQAPQASKRQCASTEVAAPLLIYSAATPEEFALMPRLLRWHQQGLLRLQLHTTRRHLDKTPSSVQCQHQQQQPRGECGDSQSKKQQDVLQLLRVLPGVTMKEGRITQTTLQSALSQLCHLHLQNVNAYVCGPPLMTDEMIEWLVELGMPSSAIRTEKWW